MPNRVKMFAWWMVHVILSTFANLSRYKVPTSSMCKICNLSNEYELHALSLCDGVLEVCNQCSLEIKLKVLTIFIDLDMDVISFSKLEEL